MPQNVGVSKEHPEPGHAAQPPEPERSWGDVAWDTFVQPVTDGYDAYGSGLERVFYRGMQGDYAGAAKAGLGSFLGAASESSYFGPSLIPHGLPLQDPLKASMAEAANRLDPEAAADGAAAVPYVEFVGDLLVEAVTAGTATGALAAKRGATGVKSAAGALRSPSNLLGVERASEELIEAMRQKGRAIRIAKKGTDDLRLLDLSSAEANVGGEHLTHILLRENPSKAALLEEFLYGTQWRSGIIQRLGRQAAEVHVKDFMIRHQRLLGLIDEDVLILKKLRDMEAQIAGLPKAYE